VHNDKLLLRTRGNRYLHAEDGRGTVKLTATHSNNPAVSDEIWELVILEYFFPNSFRPTDFKDGEVRKQDDGHDYMWNAGRKKWENFPDKPDTPRLKANETGGDNDHVRIGNDMYVCHPDLGERNADNRGCNAYHERKVNGTDLGERSKN